MNRFEFFDNIPAIKQADRIKIQWAYVLAKKWHEDQFRDSGERYFEHVRGVATILIDEGFADADMIIFGLLHDILEDTTVPLSMIEQLFGPKIARGILTVSKSYGIEDPLTGFVIKTEKKTKQVYFDGIARGGSRPAIAKCADRLHNLSDLVGNQPDGSRWTNEKRLDTVRETREWILPLAELYAPRFEERLSHLCDEIKAQTQ